MRVFIKNYYKDEIYIKTFDKAVKANKEVNQKFKKYDNIFEKREYLVSLGTKWDISNKENKSHITID